MSLAEMCSVPWLATCIWMLDFSWEQKNIVLLLLLCYSMHSYSTYVSLAMSHGSKQNWCATVFARAHKLPKCCNWVLCSGLQFWRFSERLFALKGMRQKSDTFLELQIDWF